MSWGFRGKLFVVPWRETRRLRLRASKGSKGSKVDAIGAGDRRAVEGDSDDAGLTGLHVQQWKRHSLTDSVVTESLPICHQCRKSMQWILVASSGLGKDESLPNYSSKSVATW